MQLQHDREPVTSLFPLDSSSRALGKNSLGAANYHEEELMNGTLLLQPASTEHLGFSHRRSALCKGLEAGCAAKLLAFDSCKDMGQICSLERGIVRQISSPLSSDLARSPLLSCRLDPCTDV